MNLLYILQSWICSLNGVKPTDPPKADLQKHERTCFLTEGNVKVTYVKRDSSKCCIAFCQMMTIKHRNF